MSLRTTPSGATSATGTGRRAPSLEEFTAQATSFLDAHADPATPAGRAASADPGLVPVFAHDGGGDAAVEITAARRWARRRFDAGLAWVDGPPAYGGRGLPTAYADAYRRLEAAYDTPSLTPLMVGVKIAVPTILAHGGDELRERYVPSILAGDVVVCQLFSEPGAGSDLAGLATRAVADGDGWRIDGQKVWTSEAQHADVGLLLARTSTDKPRHRGLTMFVADVRDPAVTIRPLRQMTGDFHFNEVFIDGLRIDDRSRIGGVDEGWRAARTVLGSERQAVGARDDSPESALLARLTALVTRRRSSAGEDRLVREALARAYVAVRVLEATNGRHAAQVAPPSGAEASVAKLLKNRALAAIMTAAEQALGPAITADTGECGVYPWARALSAVPGQRIAGGTDEIQRNLLAERALGLPRDPV